MPVRRLLQLIVTTHGDPLHPIPRKTSEIKSCSWILTLEHQFCTSLDSLFIVVCHTTRRHTKEGRQREMHKHQGLSGHQLAIKAFRLGKERFPSKLVKTVEQPSKGSHGEDPRQHQPSL